MSNLRILPIEPLPRKSEKHGIFTHIARFTDEESSFYLSVGTALLESLIRMKLCKRMGDPTWAKLTGKFEAARSVAEEYNLTGPFDSFTNLVSVLKETEIIQARDWLKFYLENNYQDAVFALNIGMRCVLASLKREEPQYVGRIMDMSPFNLREQTIVLTKMIERLCLYTSIVSFDEDPIISDNTTTYHNMLICIYKDRDIYYVAYDQQLLYVWENLVVPPEGLEVFPFTHHPNSHPDNSLHPSIENLIHWLAKEACKPSNQSVQLFQTIENAIGEFPSLNQSYLGDLRNKLSRSN